MPKTYKNDKTPEEKNLSKIVTKLEELERFQRANAKSADIKFWIKTFLSVAGLIVTALTLS